MANPEMQVVVHVADRFKVRCEFCRTNITQDNGLYLVADAVWHKVFGWLCYYCAQAADRTE